MSIRLTSAREGVLLSLPIGLEDFDRNERRVARRLIVEGLVKFNSRSSMFDLTFRGKKVTNNL